MRVADWRIKMQKKRAEEMLRSLLDDPSATSELKEQAHRDVEALTRLQLELSRKRVQAIISA
jgi:hypothetical protein